MWRRVAHVHSKSVLVTGGSGSFGNAFVRQCLDDGARKVVVFSRDELKQAEMRQRFSAHPLSYNIRWILGDVRDYTKVEDALRGIDVCIHAAAMKRVESCESDPREAYATNIQGTQNVARACIERGVARAILLSTDKAPSPTTLYGATKLAAVRLWLASNVYAAGTPTKLSASRYGNVMGSRGSVLGYWMLQSAKGEPLTITDESATRFWMRLSDAVGLVNLALDEMRGGEVFIPRVGSASILTLARAVVEIDGQPYAPGHVCTGLGPGERLHETLISADEAKHTYDAGTHYVIEPHERSWGTLPNLPYPKVAETFSYRSDTNEQQLTAEALRELIAA